MEELLNNEEQKEYTVREIEKLIIKRYRKTLWAKFTKSLRDYNLIEEGDKVAVAISGGKDSLLMAKMLQELQRHQLIKFDLEFISMNPGFDEENFQGLLDNCKKLGIPVKVKESNVFAVAEKLGNGKPCYMCARMRRGFLYQFAEELGCNKLALGHHFDDVIETTLINMLFASEFKTMLPILDSTNFSNMKLIRPLYQVREVDIIRFFKYIGIKTMNCGCAVTKKVEGSKRKVVKNLIQTLKEINPKADYSIFESANNVNIDAILGYRINKEKINFLDESYKKDLKDTTK